MSLALLLLFVALILGILGFGITNAVAHIAKFLFFVVILCIFVLLVIGYFTVNPPNISPIPVPDTSQPQQQSVKTPS